jgi:Sugar (and other) transporter
LNLYFFSLLKVYIAEMAEPRLRGILIGAPFVFYSSGILLVYALGATLHWRLVAWCGCVLPVLSMITLFLMPESPAWLARNNKMERASKALSWLRGGDLAAKTELLDLVARFKAEKQTSAMNESFWQSLNKMSVTIPLVIINLFQLLQIFSGTYLVVFYAVDIISEIGGEEMNTMTAAVLTAVARLCFTILFCFLLLFVKRRPMIIGSGLGSGIAAIVLSIFMYVRLGEPKHSWDIYFTALTILIYIGSNTGFMCMPGIMIGELLPAKIRGQVAGYIFSLFNITLFLVAKVFPFAKQVLKTQGCFMVFGISSLVASLMLYLMLPETKEQSLGEIEDYFNQKNWLWFKRSRTSTKPTPPTKVENCA